VVQRVATNRVPAVRIAAKSSKAAGKSHHRTNRKLFFIVGISLFLTIIDFEY
jgi:hypothetical protein